MTASLRLWVSESDQHIHVDCKRLLTTDALKPVPHKMLNKVRELNGGGNVFKSACGRGDATHNNRTCWRRTPTLSMDACRMITVRSPPGRRAMPRARLVPSPPSFATPWSMPRQRMIAKHYANDAEIMRT